MIIHHFYLFLNFRLARNNSLLNISCRGLAVHLSNAVSHNHLPSKKCLVLCSLTFYFPVWAGRGRAAPKQVFRNWQTEAEMHCHIKVNKISAQALVMIPPHVLSPFLVLPTHLLLLLASNSKSDACSTKINMCFLQKTILQTNLNKNLTFWKSTQENKLLNENQHIHIHGNYAEGKLSAVVASSRSARNVPYTTLLLLYYKLPQARFPD